MELFWICWCKEEFFELHATDSAEFIYVLFSFNVCKIVDSVHVCAKLNNAGMYSTYLNIRELIISKSCMSPVPWDICVSSDTLCIINMNLLMVLM